MSGTKHQCRERGAAATGSGGPSPSAVSVYESRALLGTGREIIIRHGDECYRLRVTRHNKLILTK